MRANRRHWSAVALVALVCGAFVSVPGRAAGEIATAGDIRLSADIASGQSVAVGSPFTITANVTRIDPSYTYQSVMLDLAYTVNLTLVADNYSCSRLGPAASGEADGFLSSAEKLVHDVVPTVYPTALQVPNVGVAIYCSQWQAGTYDPLGTGEFVSVTLRCDSPGPAAVFFQDPLDSFQNPWFGLAHWEPAGTAALSTSIEPRVQLSDPSLATVPGFEFECGASTPTPEPDRLVVFVPGISQLDRPFEPCSRSTTAVDTEYWAPLRSHIALLGPNFKFAYFSYRGIDEAGAPQPYSPCDTWRGLSDIASTFQQEFDVWKERYDRIDLVGHSLGGVVVAYWAGSASDEDLRKVGSANTFESPLRGMAAWKADVIARYFSGLSRAPIAASLRDATALGVVRHGLSRVPSSSVTNRDDCVVNGTILAGIPLDDAPMWYADDSKMGPISCSEISLIDPMANYLRSAGLASLTRRLLESCSKLPTQFVRERCTSRLGASLRRYEGQVTESFAKITALVGDPHMSPTVSPDRWAPLDRMLRDNFVDVPNSGMTCSPAFLLMPTSADGNIGGSALSGTLSGASPDIQCEVQVEGPGKELILHDATLGQFYQVAVDGVEMTLKPERPATGRQSLRGTLSISAGKHMLSVSFGACLGGSDGAGSPTLCPVQLDGVEVVR